MAEVQNHGFVFENWIKHILGVDTQASKYTQKWDVVGKTYISIKFMGEFNSLELSSAERFWETKETFVMIIGRWRQVGDKKMVVSIDELQFTPEIMRKLKGEISSDELAKFNNKIKSYPSGRENQIAGSKFAKDWKKEHDSKMGLLNIAAKLDSKNQRRVQCNLSYQKYVELFGRPSGSTSFRGHSFNQQIDSGARTYHNK